MGKKLGFILIVLLAFTTSFYFSSGTNASNDDEVTRGEYLVSLFETLGIDVGAYGNVAEKTFSDVSDELAPYTEAGLKLGIVSGIDATTFGPNEKITREQAYIFLIRALNLSQSYDFSKLKFGDLNQVSNWARGEVAAAVELKLLSGHYDGTLRLQSPLLKEHMNVIFERYHTNFERVSIVHTNDLHGRVMYNEANGELGFAKIASVVNGVRKSNPNTLVLDIGDTFHGTNHVNFNEGMSAVDAMNLINYNAMAAGNHDFNFGFERLVEFNNLTNFPILSSNVTAAKTEETILPAYTIVEVAGKKFGLLGITAEDTTVKTHPDNIKGLVFDKEINAATSYIEELKEKVDHIIILSHSGYDVDKEIVDAVNGVNLILGGHSHTTVEKPELYKGTYITQAFEHGKAIGVTHLLFHKDKLIGVHGQLVRDHDGIQQDQAVKKMLDVYDAEIKESLGVVIGSVGINLDGARENVRVKETNLGNLVTDAMRDLVKSDIAITNGGGIRDSIASGEVKLENVIAAFPFPNYVISIEQTGAQIKQALEHSVRVYPEQNGGFLQTSGLTYSFDPSKPAGSRIVEVKINGEVLEAEKVYSVATNDFIAAGGDGYVWLKEGKLLINTGEYLSQVVADYIRAGKTIADVEDRIVVVK